MKTEVLPSLQQLNDSVKQTADTLQKDSSPGAPSALQKDAQQAQAVASAPADEQREPAHDREAVGDVEVEVSTLVTVTAFVEAYPPAVLKRAEIGQHVWEGPVAIA